MNLRELASIGWRKARAAGGGSRPYWEDGSKITPTVGGETAFAKAVQIVDRRDGYAMQIARLWRSAAISAAVVASGLGAGWLHQAQQATVEYLIVPVDRFGEPGEITAPAEFKPTGAMLADRTERTIEAAFGLSIDPAVNEARYEFLKAVLVGAAVKTWSDWWRDTKDTATERTVRIVTVKPTASPNTINAIWDEVDFKDGAKVAERRVNGDFTLEYRRPKDRDTAYRNKLGIYVTNMRFAAEAKP